MATATDLRIPQTPTLRFHAQHSTARPPQNGSSTPNLGFSPSVSAAPPSPFAGSRPPNVLNVVLQPGMAFGTGENPPTQFCARWSLDSVTPDMELLDFRTGSGVLAILAAMLEDGVIAVGVYIDPNALSVARESAKRKRVEKRVSFVDHGEKPPGRMYDLVVANILAGPLRTLADHLVSRMTVGGRTALSGLLLSQAEEMKQWYPQRGVAMDNVNVDFELDTPGWYEDLNVRFREQLTVRSVQLFHDRHHLQFSLSR